MLEVILLVSIGLFILVMTIACVVLMENQRSLKDELRKEKRKRNEEAIKEKMDRAKESHGDSVEKVRRQQNRDSSVPLSNPIIYPVGTGCSSSSSSSSSDSGSSSSSGGC